MFVRRNIILLDSRNPFTIFLMTRSSLNWLTHYLFSSLGGYPRSTTHFHQNESHEIIMNSPYTILQTLNSALVSQVLSTAYFNQGMRAYNNEFLNPLLMAVETFAGVENKRFLTRSPEENFKAYCTLFQMNFDLFTRYTQGSLKALEIFNTMELERFYRSLEKSISDKSGEPLQEYYERNQELLKSVVEGYPDAIQAIEPEYGFHFERDSDSLIVETDRFYLRRVKPSVNSISTDENLKPMIIVPPFVLGANILAFLPGEKKSYAHSFANKGIPTYIVIIKDIHETPKVQTMTLEDYAKDTRIFCETVKKRHGLPVTLNGYCQGGFSSLCNILSGELDGLVDSLITCVAPMDGTKSEGLGNLLQSLPQPFNDLAYGTKVLPNGNRIANGDLMGWVYKLKSIENSGPVVAFLRDIMMLGTSKGKVKVNKTVAALNYWLNNERSDLPISMTEMSFSSYSTPITKDGTLPISMFGKKLNIHAIKDKKISWLLCYGMSDDLVEKEVALAPLDHIDVEVTPFPKGHVAIATSWSHPDSECSLDSLIGEEKKRGPVRFHLDLAKKLATKK